MQTLLDVALGMTLVFFLTAVLCSSLFEVIARIASARGKMLREGLLSLVPDRWLYLRLVNHPLVSSLYRGSPGKGSPPSYLPARNFAHALADTLLSSEAAVSGRTRGSLSHAALRTALLASKQRDESVGHALLPVVDAAPNLETALAGVEQWFDSTMDRVNGWYKVHAQKRLFAIGLAVAVAFDIDALQIASTLASSENARAQAVSAAVAAATDDADAPRDARMDLYALGIGRRCTEATNAVPAAGETALMSPSDYGNCIRTSLVSRFSVLALVGWIITAAAASFGAAFWFDAMKRLVNMRAAGHAPKPSARA